MKFPYQKIEKLKPTYKLGILIVTFLLLPLIFFFAVYNPTHKKISGLEKKISSLQKEVTNLKNVESKIIDIEKENKEIESQMNRKEEEIVNSELFISDKNELHDVMQTFYRSAREVGLEKVDFKSGNEVPKEFYNELHFGFSAGGRYVNILNFLKKIDSEKRIINVYSFEMGRIGKLRELAEIKVDLPGEVMHEIQREQVGSMVDFLCNGYIYQIKPEKLVQEKEEDKKTNKKRKRK